MKFLHLSDLHLGKRLKEQSFIEDQKYILEQIIGIAESEKPDGIIIAGDIYDKAVPSAEAVALFDNFLTRLTEMKLKIYAISGNHDSAERIAFGSQIMKASNVYFSPVYNGHIEKITVNDTYGNINIFLLPFIRPAQVREFFPDTEIKNYTEAVKAALSNIEINKSERNIIVTHQNVTNSQKSGSEEMVIGGLDNVDSYVFEKFDYVALGHIHRPQDFVNFNLPRKIVVNTPNAKNIIKHIRCCRNITRYIHHPRNIVHNISKTWMRYCGTPLKYSFSEIGHTKSVTILEFNKSKKPCIRTITLMPLHDMREIKGNFKEIYDKNEKSDDYIRIGLTDEDNVMDAVSKLRSIYPNILELRYLNRKTYATEALKATENDIKNNPSDIFKKFFTEQTGSEPDDEIMKIMKEIIKQAKEKEKKNASIKA